MHFGVNNVKSRVSGGVGARFVAERPFENAAASVEDKVLRVVKGNAPIVPNAPPDAVVCGESFGGEEVCPLVLPSFIYVVRAALKGYGGRKGNYLGRARKRANKIDSTRVRQVLRHLKAQGEVEHAIKGERSCEICGHE